MVPGVSNPSPAVQRPRNRTALLALGAALLLAGCQFGPKPEQKPSLESQRIDQLEFQLQQLEQRLNKLTAERADGADRAGKPPAGVVKSLTLRSGTDDDRLRIYWSDGSTTDLPCTREQATLVCG
jgi:type II secretory pathway component PulM